MKKTMKKILALGSGAALLVTASVMGTMAYLSSTTGVVKNTFTFGQVNITLDEEEVTEYGIDTDKDVVNRVQANTYKLIPGHNYLKDPTIHVAAGSEECYLFVKVVDGLANIEAENTIATQMAANGWSSVSGAENVYAYSSTVDAREAKNEIDVKVFDNFTLKTDANVADYSNAEITITAYAIQADGFTSSDDAWSKAPAWN